MTKIVNVCARAVLAAGFIALLASCGGEHIATPTPVSQLASMRLETTVVVDTSSQIEGTPLPDSSRLFDFAFSPLSQSGNCDDISIELMADVQRMPEALAVFDFGESSWKTIEGAVEASGAYFCLDRCLTQITRVTSEIPGSTVSDFISSEGRVRIKAAGGWGIKARLVRYDPSYVRATVTPTLPFQYRALIPANGVLRVCSDHVEEATDRLVDSLIGIDLEGHRLWGVEHDLQEAYQAAFDGQAYWFLDGLDGHLRRVDSAGQITASILAPLGYVGGMCWWRSSLWIVRRPYGSSAFVSEIDIDSSLASGSVVERFSFAFPVAGVGNFCADSAGLIASYDGHVIWHTDTGDEIRRVQRPDLLISAMASDGQSLWVLHYGPKLAETDAGLLTRFALE